MSGCATRTGWSGQDRNWVYALAFALVMSVAVYVILDYEFPRVGFIRIQGFEEVLIDLQQSMSHEGWQAETLRYPSAKPKPAHCSKTSAQSTIELLCSIPWTPFELT